MRLMRRKRKENSGKKKKMREGNVDEGLERKGEEM